MHPVHSVTDRESREAAWYRAYVSRDSRFDGVFFLGVLSTGIYCRPICPARTPHREHVRFFRTATEAEQVGFRACKRCHPERAPRTHGESSLPAEVRRALGLIENGFLDDGTFESLAGRIGITSRHLRRLFLEHLGITPVALATTRRIQDARQLIENSTLSLTRIAFEAGFQSIRSFNAAMKKAFHVSPGELRRMGSRGSGARSEVELRFSCRPPFDRESVWRRLRENLIPGLEKLGERTYEKLLRVGGQVVSLRIRHEDGTGNFRLRVTSRQPPACHLRRLVTRARILVDAAADPPSLEGVPGVPPGGLRLVGALDPLQVTVRLLLEQELERDELLGVLRELCDPVDPVEAAGSELDLVFPVVDSLQRALSRVDLPSRSRALLEEVGSRLSRGEIELATQVDPFQLRDRLLEVSGVEVETAVRVALAVTGYPDLDDPAGTHRAASPWRSYARMAAEFEGEESR